MLLINNKSINLPSLGELRGKSLLFKRFPVETFYLRLPVIFAVFYGKYD